ncbi:envelope biogenesis factor ElyC [Photobacterium galatheae]|uniref:Membrane protein n=1 Tax=Photobacterium galatheae TaxID=1654360 RepID=A0A066RWL1_9GAMM|nr:envelope biogenesis factor ElyC [Photobacterium galatheae]KDM91768.1 membrane protein [Photobacterium galatheae]MCM0147139.1 envelope biogenesis factor ElyC [Photobacterium galatheae]
MFELKKILSAFLMPLPLLLIIGVTGLMVLWFTRRQKLASVLLACSLLGIFLVAFQPLSTRLLSPLEREYKGYIPSGQPVDYIMVLGNSHVVDKELPMTSELSRASLMRLAEAIRIHNLSPGSKIILSGYDGGTEISQARMMAKVATALGVNKLDVLLLETAKDTWEEAFQAASVVGKRNLVLVTSASHMPRAIAEFKLAGLDPIPAPTNFLASNKIHQPWLKYAPKAQYLEQTERFWHETLGQWWQKLRDMADSAAPVNVVQPVTKDTTA